MHPAFALVHLSFFSHPLGLKDHPFSTPNPTTLNFGPTRSRRQHFERLLIRVEIRAALDRARTPSVRFRP